MCAIFSKYIYLVGALMTGFNTSAKNKVFNYTYLLPYTLEIWAD